MILSASYDPTLVEEVKGSFVVKKVKEIVRRLDEHSEIILFGSRARGDWHEESDWDFLILSEQDEKGNTKEKIRERISKEIEHTTFDVVFTLFHNKRIWEQNY